MSDAVTTEIRDKVAVVTFDDGKANALSPDAITALHGALDEAEKQARALALIGRPGRLSAGFDLSVMRSGADAMRGLVTAGAELLMRLYEHPQPTVIACTGHALAAGALLVLSCDTRIGVRGDYKIGLNEVAIGMPLPIFAVELARDRLSRRHFQAATIQARIYDPEGALDAGYLDRVTDPEKLVGEAIAAAAALAEFAPGAYAGTKSQARGAIVQHVRDTLEADMTRMTGPSS